MIELEGAGGVIEQPRTGQLRGEDGLEAAPGLLRQRAVVDDAGGVEHAPQRHARRGDPRPARASTSRGIGDIRRQHLDGGAGMFQCGDHLGRVGGGRAAPAQRHVAGAPLDQPAGHGEADAAEAAGDEVGAVGPDRRGGGVGRAGTVPDEPGHQPSPVAIGDLVLAGLGSQVGDESADGIGAGGRIELDRRAPQRRVLVGDDPAETPQGGLGRRDDLAADRLAAARHQPQAGVERRAVGDALGEDERAVEGVLEGGVEPVERRRVGGGVEAAQVHHAGRRRQRRQRLVEHAPVRRRVPAPVRDPHDRARRPGGAEAGGQFVAGPAARRRRSATHGRRRRLVAPPGPTTPSS